jgi:hypothetical protein
MIPQRVTGPPLSQLLAMRPRELAVALRSGHPIAPEALDDTRYRGISLGLPAWIEKLAWKTFVKTFKRSGDVLRGWNVRLEQTGLDGEVVYQQLKNGEPKTFGHYHVVDAGPNPVGAHRGLLIHYGLGGNPIFDPSGLMRDPLVALEPDSVDRLLGWSYVDLRFSVGTPSYFMLERLGPLDHDATPPRG